MKKAILTVIGSDKVGIIAAVSGYLASVEVNILDISQTTMQEFFTMIMLVDVSVSSVRFDELCAELERLGAEIGMKIQLQYAEIFNSMHKI